ncbi:hypothetical protein B0A55_05591 [Friedmanniomyces simplex]|uniref:Glycine zipper 2TM domain-containing protein n=1 Tax=Friedmanniomyces simplex TaxID=329884 RepID=A0A4U0XI71_9PEZI|nr:hypothetical protein B0A55_05591 [Friedmanniomyces simplex]
MAEEFVELGIEAVNHVTDKHWDTIHDHSARVIRKGTGRKRPPPPPSSAGGGDRGRDQQDPDSKPRRYRYELPSPERERGTQQQRDDSLERQSETSARVTSAYRNERDDPVRPVDPALEKRRRRDSARMSYANGYGARDDRAHSAQPPRNRYYDDDGDSDYDEREGRRYKSGGARGYEDRDDDRGYDREVVETERYRGVSGALVPARPQDARRNDTYTSRAHDGPYGAGAMAPYRRSQNDLTQVSRRTRSRGRTDRDRSRSYSRSRSRSDSRGGGGGSGKEGWRGKLDEHFDTSMQGLGVGLAGAVAGALAGRQFGNKHKERDILVGALIGGLGANLAENKYKDFREEREEKKERGGRREQRYEGGAGGWNGEDDVLDYRDGGAVEGSGRNREVI